MKQTRTADAARLVNYSINEEGPFPIVIDFYFCYSNE